MKRKLLNWLEMSVFGYFLTNFKWFRKEYGGLWVKIGFINSKQEMWMPRETKLGEIEIKREVYHI